LGFEAHPRPTATQNSKLGPPFGFRLQRATE
jgi:hypothetical protein